MSKLKDFFKDKFMFQFIASILLLVAGVGLLYCGFFFYPIGVIDNSVLIAFGEICTFVGSLFGIDYSYKSKMYNRTSDKS